MIFKGSGFYSTDYRSEGYQKAAKQETSTTTAPSAAEKKAEATPAKTTKKD
jgi:hypothetical protein